MVQIIVCDQRMPGTSGVEFLRRVRSQWPDTLRIILSGYTDAEDIIAGVNEAGIYQYLLKPWQPEQLLLTLQTAARVHRLQQENQRLSLELRTAEPVLARRVDGRQERARREFALDGLIRGPQSPLNAVCDLVERIAPFDLSVLISGESGTGKEMLARAIHYRSRRSDKAFVVEHCGALPDQLLEAELFGYKRGAFSCAYEDRSGRFQQADGGTIFLDEIGDTSPVFQVKLLRVMQEGEFRPLGAARPQSVDVRVVAATHHDLEAEVRAGTFREDLYYRLATVTLRVPPLRERAMDISLLAGSLLDASQKFLGKTATGFSTEALAASGRLRRLHAVAAGRRGACRRAGATRRQWYRAVLPPRAVGGERQRDAAAARGRCRPAAVRPAVDRRRTAARPEWQRPIPDAGWPAADRLGARSRTTRSACAGDRHLQGLRRDHLRRREP